MRAFRADGNDAAGWTSHALDLDTGRARPIGSSLRVNAAAPPADDGPPLLWQRPGRLARWEPTTGTLRILFSLPGPRPAP